MSRKAYLKHKTPTNATFLRNIWYHDDDGGKKSGSFSSMRTNKSYIFF